MSHSSGKKIPAHRTETSFSDFKPPLSPGRATTEANRCLYCHDAPCVEACPTSIDIPEFIRKIGTGNLRGAARTILKANIFGMSCSRVCPVEVLCVADCVFNKMDAPPVPIGKLQRRATDKALDAGWRFFSAGPDSGRSVGLVGGGPASLAAAHSLRRMGHACTIYDRRQVLGGLNTWGVAPYKLRADRAAQEVDWIMAIGGIETELGVAVGSDDLPWDELIQRHDALFLGFGLGEDRWLQLPGADLPGVAGAVDYIEQLKLGTVPIEGVKHAVVVGGGNTAVDVVREVLGLGVPEVTMVYRREEAQMSGYLHEWEVAKVAGAKVIWRALPEAFEGTSRLERVRCVQLDEQSRPRAESEVYLDADLALVAIGQSPLVELAQGLSGVQVEGGRVLVDHSGSTTRPGVFAGGDCVNGGKEVVNAVAEGDLAAQGIDAYLSREGGTDA